METLKSFWRFWLNYFIKICKIMNFSCAFLKISLKFKNFAHKRHIYMYISSMIQSLTVKNNLLSIPDWETAKDTLLPLLAPADNKKESLPALRSDDILCRFVTNNIKMYLACIYNGSVIPLTENLLAQWSVSAALISLAIDENLSKLASDACFERHKNGRFEYFSLHHPIGFISPLLLFYRPFQDALCEKFGGTFYAAAPEITTAVVFKKKYANSYNRVLRDDVILTYDCSTKPLSKELIEISNDGAFSVGI